MMVRMENFLIQTLEYRLEYDSPIDFIYTFLYISSLSMNAGNNPAQEINFFQ